MSSKKDLSKPHRALTAKLKGTMVDPPETYGTWAYWWGDVENPRDSGWHNAPRPKEDVNLRK